MSLTPEERRERKNARQREYAKRTGYAASNKSAKQNSRQFLLKFAKSTDSEVIEKLDCVPNKIDYVRQLILDDIKNEKPGHSR